MTSLHRTNRNEYYKYLLGLLSPLAHSDAHLCLISLLHRTLHRSPSDPDACAWLPGARLNIAQCALSGSRRNVPWASPPPSSPPPLPADDPSRPVIVYAEEGRPEEIHVVTLGQLRDRAAHVACCLRSAGLVPGGPVSESRSILTHRQS